MSFFDGIQKQLFETVQNLFGDEACWIPSDGSLQQSALGLYNCPQTKAQMGDTQKFDYSPYNNWFEYYQDQLPGLKTSVDKGETEQITINNQSFYVREVSPKYDGKTLVAFLEPL